MLAKLKAFNFGPIVSIFSIVFIAALAFSLGSVWTSYRAKNASAQGTTAENQAPALEKPRDTDHIRGNKDAKFAVVEYSDFDCPFCITFHETMTQLMPDYGDRLMWVFRHYPIDSRHPEARKKAEASECVAELGGNDKFWEFSDKLYSAQPRLADLPTIVTELGIDVNKFNDCLASGKYASKVQAELEEGTKSGVEGTPGNFFLEMASGRSIPMGGALPLDNFKQFLDSTLK